MMSTQRAEEPQPGAVPSPESPPPAANANLYRAIFERAADAILVVDSEGHILLANAPAATLSGYMPEVLAGLPLAGLGVTLSPGVTRWQALLNPAAGDPRPVEITCAPLGAPLDGQMVLILRDFSDHIEALQSYEQLTAELDDFAHTVAHDLQNPLNNILHSMSMLQGDLLRYPRGTVTQITGVAIRSTHKALNIIDELLLLAGVRQDQQVPILPLQMAAIIAEVQDRLQYLIGDTDARLIVPESWPVALGYAPWVEEVWANYITNAIKYGGEPPVVTLGGDEPHDGYIRFWVEDNGKGIPAEQAEALFKPFTRVQGVRAQGYGLGLSIVRRIVTRLGGDVGVEPAPGGGARFSFTLPAAPVDPE